MAVLLAVTTNSLTGVFSTGLRSVTERLTGGKSLSVHSKPYITPCGSSWVIPDRKPTPEPSKMPSSALRSQETMETWLRRNKAVDAGETTVELTLRGRSGTALVLKEIRVRIVERRAPVPAMAINNGCGGDPLPPRLYEVDLDAARPVARPVPDGGDLHGAPAAPFPYKVTNADPEVIRVVASTDGYDCRWTLELVYVDGDKELVKVIDDHGKPFRTIGAAKKPAAGKN
ncbi:hypothetical protein E1287_23575 [Actinomadura sp. KC06]|uniref:hypothetical protein n=1 Tax=Actinomadura sp. KC06 TaxID=2530369 RepID=UPI00104D4EAB|nr:hypothetical protein [Actinomadura sp. KC06]TDD32209.1 hypothetical protein E1287_23575 [Actinomadura sp. KC06]